MINLLWIALARALLWLRYRVRVEGLKAVAEKGRTGILFLPNHPALIDPVILTSRLWPTFHVRALADSAQVDRFFIRRLARGFRVLPIPDLDKPDTGTPEDIRKVVASCVEALRAGDNLVLYPQGRLDRQRLEDLGAGSAVESILRELPDIRVVLVRTRGLWGSAFSYASGTVPDVARTIKRGAISTLAGGVFFAPRRPVSIELVEPVDLPRTAGRTEINRWLERFYNESAPPNTYVPYSPWERGGVRVLPEPVKPRIEGDLSLVSKAVRETVIRHIAEATGAKDIAESTRLAHDLGMDSLARMELIAWLQTEFGTAPVSPDALGAVGDCMLAASGQAVAATPQALKDVPRKWFEKLPHIHRPDGLADMTIPQAFLLQASRTPDAVIVADQTSGVRTYRDMVLGAMVLGPEIRTLPGERVGIMLPASVAADVTFMSVLFAGRTAAMINWTLGTQNLKSCLATAGVERILTSRALVLRLAAQGIDLAPVSDRFVYLDDLAARVGIARKLWAWVCSRLSWQGLRRAKPPEVAAVLFTSGSESVPKAVPLTHRNILANVADCFDLFHAQPDESILGILPPFHSFGLTTSVVLPLVLGGHVVHYPNPTDGAALARMVEAYRPSLLMGTPTFLHGIVRAASGEQMSSLRLVVSGAEKCSDRVYRALSERCAKTVVMEGYGVTECSPVISANREWDHRPGTIGKPVTSVEIAIVEEKGTVPSAASGGQSPFLRVAQGHEGMLLVRGPSIFAGYLNYAGASPFVEFEGKSWYRTGDLVREGPDGWLTFAGRLKRFVKLGGEMVSLPAIEAVLDPRLASDDDDGPAFAVAATPVEESPEIVLFTTKPIERDEANSIIRAAGLSGLHNIRRVIMMEALPLLGTGKTDYRALAERLKTGA